MTTRRILVLVVLAVLTLSACSDKSKVGSGVNLNIKEAAGQGRLGQRTTTTVAPTATSVQAKAAVGQTTTTAKPVTTTAAPTTTAPQQAAIEIDINGDNAGATQFDPAAVRVYTGSIVKWTNKDSTPRSVEADDGSFNSGPIAAGASWSYKMLKAGDFNYHDGTRPYAVASIEVIAK